MAAANEGAMREQQDFHVANGREFIKLGADGAGYYKWSGGIINPARRELHRDTILFRLGAKVNPVSLEDNLENAAKGRWWMSKRDFNAIERFARVAGYSLPTAIRLACIHPPEWGKLDTLVKVRVLTHLGSWQGKGRVVLSKEKPGLQSATQILTGNLNITQIFIPGLVELRHSAIKIEEYTPLRTREHPSVFPFRAYGR